jgi:hypothetical protein
MKFCLVIGALFLASCSQEPLELPIENFQNLQYSNTSTADIFDFNTTGVTIEGTSTLKRNRNGINVNFKTSNLIKGHAYTLWWVVWNKPENCSGYPGACTDADFALANEVEVVVLYATGHVAGSNGKGNFSAHLSENDASGSINDLFGLPLVNGLYNAETAEVHLVLRSHGPATPGLIQDQIHSYEGGCEVELGTFTGLIPAEQGECGDIQAAVHQI